MFKFMAGMYVGGATLISAIFGIHRSGPPAPGPSDLAPLRHEQGMMHEGDGTSSADMMGMGSTTPGARGDDRGSGMTHSGTSTSDFHPGMTHGLAPLAPGRPIDLGHGTMAGSSTAPRMNDGKQGDRGMRSDAPRALLGKVLSISGTTISVEARIPRMTASGTPDSLNSMNASTTVVSVDASGATVFSGFASTTASFSDIAVGSQIGVEGKLETGSIIAKVIRIAIDPVAGSISGSAESGSSTRPMMAPPRHGDGPRENPPQSQQGQQNSGLQSFITGFRR